MEATMKLFQKNVEKKTFIILMAAFTLVRIFFTAFQRVTLMPDESMLDDYLVYEAAKNISAGNWLGEYSFMTIGKHMLFSVWLAFLNWAGIPYLLAGQTLYVTACLVFVLAFNPVIKNRLLQLLFYIFLVFNPASYADFTLRVYRDNITTAVSLIVFASIIGFALRVRSEKTTALWLYGISGGLALGSSFLLREDGVWVLPFVVAGALISLWFLFRGKEKKKLQRILALSMVGVITGISILSFCAVNYRHYGRFIVSDMTSKEFYDASGAMTRVIVAEEDQNPIVTLPRAAREILYESSPMFAELEQYLESDYFSRMRKDVGGDVDDYSGGGYYWGVRNAVSLLGYYEDAETAKDYYTRLAKEINALCDSGAIDAGSPRSGLNAPITFERVGPTFRETANEIISVLFYRDMKCAPGPSTGSRYKISEMEEYLHTKAFTLTQAFNDDNLVVVTAFSSKGPVSVGLLDEKKNIVDIDVAPATGSDIYLDHLLSTGEDFLYMQNLRSYLRYAEKDDAQYLRLTVNGETTIVDLSLSEQTTVDDITYSVEYIGKDYVETDEAEYSFLELWSYRLTRVMVWVYRIINPLLFLLGVIALVANILKLLKLQKKKLYQYQTVILFWVSFGILLIALFRLVMMAFVEVSAFGIGTYPMYFAVAFPLFIAFSFSSILTYTRIKKESASQTDADKNT